MELSSFHRGNSWHRSIEFTVGEQTLLQTKNPWCRESFEQTVKCNRSARGNCHGNKSSWLVFPDIGLFCVYTKTLQSTCKCAGQKREDWKREKRQTVDRQSRHPSVPNSWISKTITEQNTLTGKSSIMFLSKQTWLHILVWTQKHNVNHSYNHTGLALNHACIIKERATVIFSSHFRTEVGVQSWRITPVSRVQGVGVCSQQTPQLLLLLFLTWIVASWRCQL